MTRIDERGFTLIELMVVLSITAVLGTIGVAGFISYNQVQVLQSSASEVATMLNLAKSRAQSQIKPSSLCAEENTLTDYSVKISDNRKYTLYLHCSVGEDSLEKKITEQDKKLPQELTFDLTLSNLSFFFPVQTGGVKTSGQVVISGYGRSKTITVSSLGGVSMQ